MNFCTEKAELNIESKINKKLSYIQKNRIFDSTFKSEKLTVPNKAFKKDYIYPLVYGPFKSKILQKRSIAITKKKEDKKYSKYLKAQKRKFAIYIYDKENLE
jgi:hypothetical protein